MRLSTSVFFEIEDSNKKIEIGFARVFPFILSNSIFHLLRK